MLHMARNLAIDQRLLEDAQKIGGHKTKKATVNEALCEYIQRRQQLKIVEVFGSIDFDSDYDYKQRRKNP